MATDANQAAEGGENTELEIQTTEGAETEGADNQDTGADSPHAEIAREIGWVPRDEFDGPPEKWKPADDYIRAAPDIQRTYRTEIKSLNQKLDTIARTSASIVEQRVEERVAELAQRHQKAVDDGDPKAAFAIAREITSLTNEAPSGPPQPTPEAQAWAERNSSWFRQPGHEYATARAIEITNMLQNQGITDHAQQLKITEQRLRQEMPDLFKSGLNGRKPAPGVHSPGSRTSGPSNRQKTAADLPPEARKIAKDMTERGVIKSEDDYAKNYFANEQAKR